MLWSLSREDTCVPVSLSGACLAVRVSVCKRRRCILGSPVRPRLLRLGFALFAPGRCVLGFPGAPGCRWGVASPLHHEFPLGLLAVASWACPFAPSRCVSGFYSCALGRRFRFFRVAYRRRISACTSVAVAHWVLPCASGCCVLGSPVRSQSLRLGLTLALLAVAFDSPSVHTQLFLVICCLV